MKPLDIFQNSAEGVIAAVSVLGNALVLLTLRRSGLLRRSPTNRLIASLASADLLVGAVGIPCVIAANFSLPRHFYACLVTNCTVVIMTQMSIFSLLLIALERFVAVVAPVVHRRHSTARTVAVAVAVAWTAAVLLGLVPLFGWHPPPPPPPPPSSSSVSIGSGFDCAFEVVIDRRYMVLFNFFGCVLTPLVVIYAIYGYIYSFILRKLRAGNQHSGSAQAKEAFEKDKSKLKKESNATKRIFLILVSFTLSWMPIHIISCLNLFAGKSSLTAVIVAVLLSHSNSAINPFIYSLTNPKIMQALKTTLGIRSARVGGGLDRKPTNSVVATPVNTIA